MSNLPSYTNCVLDLRFWLGSFRDFSGNGNHATPTGVHFQKRPDKHVRFSGTDLITVADSPELQLTEGTIIVYGDFDYYANGDRLINKRDASGTNYQFYFDDSLGAALYDGATISAATIDWQGSRNVAVSFVSGDTPRFYTDGAFVSNGDNSLTISTDDADLLIGNWYLSTRPVASPLKGVLIYDTPLTDAQIAELYLWTKGTRTPSLKKSNLYSLPLSTISGDDLIASWKMNNVAGKAIDTANNNNGTITNATSSKSQSGLGAIEFRATGYINVPHNDLFNHLGAQSIAFKMRLDGLGAIFDKSSGGPPFVSQSVGRIIWGNSSGYAVTVDTFDDGKEHYIVVTYNGEYPGFDGLKVYVDGVNQALTSSGSFNGFATHPNDIKIGARFSGTSPMDGALIDSLDWYSKELTQSEVSALYKEYARLPILVDDLSDANESIAAESGSYLSNTNWRISSGSWKISREDIGKSIECVTAGILYKESQLAYGTWEFDVYKSLATYNVMIAANTIGTWSESGQDGYLLQITPVEVINLYRVTGAAVTLLGRTDASYLDTETWYSLKVTRRYDGQFSFYVKGSDGWTIAEATTGDNPVTDNSHGSSKYFVLDLGASDRIRNLKFYQGVI